MSFRNRFSARAIGVVASAGLPRTLSIKAATDTSPAELLLYDDIGTWGVSDKDFAAALAEVGDANPLALRINSAGGDVFHGVAMYNMLRNRKGDTHCVVDGLAGSAASLVAIAGDRLTMQDATFLMIHNGWTLVVGNRHDMAETVDTLAKVDGEMAGLYSKKCDKTAVEIAAAMDAETWFTGDEARAYGLADESAAKPGKKALAAQGVAYSARAAERAGLIASLDGEPAERAPVDTCETAAGVIRRVRAEKRLRIADCET